MKFSITEEKGDCLIEVTAWAGLTTFILNVLLYIYRQDNAHQTSGREFKTNDKQT
jgi:hypothetical protein